MDFSFAASSSGEATLDDRAARFDNNTNLLENYCRQIIAYLGRASIRSSFLSTSYYNKMKAFKESLESLNHNLVSDAHFISESRQRGPFKYDLTTEPGSFRDYHRDGVISINVWDHNRHNTLFNSNFTVRSLPCLDHIAFKFFDGRFGFFMIQ